MKIDIGPAIAGPLKQLELFYTNLAKTEMTKIAGEYSDNSLEASATKQAVDAVKAVVTFDGSSASLSFEFPDSEWMGVIESGKGDAVLGGNNGTVTNPDGSTHPSNVPPSLWGTPFPSAEPASNIMENVETMAQSLFPADVESVINANQDAIAKLAEPEILKMLQVS